MSSLLDCWNQLGNRVGERGGSNTPPPQYAHSSPPTQVVSATNFAKTTLHWSPSSSMVEIYLIGHIHISQPAVNNPVIVQCVEQKLITEIFVSVHYLDYGFR